MIHEGTPNRGCLASRNEDCQQTWSQCSPAEDPGAKEQRDLSSLNIDSRKITYGLELQQGAIRLDAAIFLGMVMGRYND